LDQCEAVSQSRYSVVRASSVRAPADTGLGLKLGDIPSPDLGAQRVHEQVIRAYQVQRYSPAGSLVDVTI